MSDSLGLVAAASTAALGVLALIGLVIRYVLLPYLREQLVVPVQETHRQVTVNHHTSEQPTIPDRIEDVSNQVAENTRETRALARMFDGHLEWSQNEVDRIWQALKEQRDRGER